MRTLLRFGLGIAAYAVCVALSFVSALLVFVLSVAIAGYYVVDQLTSREPVDET